MGEISRSMDDAPDLHNSSRAVLETNSRPSGKTERDSLKVLVVDDDPVTLESLTGLLTEWGYDSEAVRTGGEALERLCARDGPSIAVLDWMLPDIYGTEICRRLRASQNLRYVYLILLTGRDESTDVV